MKKIVFILLLIVFSTSAMSAGLCRNTFIPFAKKMLTRARYPGLTMAVTHELAINAFQGMFMYRFISDREFKGDMQKAYFTVLRILGEEKFRQLRWRLFNGTTLEYNTLRSFFIDPESGQVRSDYIGEDKLKMFALIAYNGNKLKAYMKVEEALEPAEFAVLGWEKPLNLPASRAVSTEFAVLGWEKPLNLPASSRAVPMRFS